jgi:hypothetical protein
MRMQIKTIHATAVTCFALALCSCGGKGGSPKKPEAAAPGEAGKKGTLKPGMTGGPVILDEDYTIVALMENLEIGNRHLKVLSSGSTTEFTETVSMHYQGTEVGWETRVTYAMDPSIAPLSAEGRTFIRKTEVMRGTLAFGGDSVELEASLLYDEYTGTFAGPIEKKTSEQLPGNIILFQSAIQVLGPQLLKEPGEIDDITFAECPDDVDSLVNFKEGRRLVREASQPDGSFVLKLFPSVKEGHPGEPACVVRFDAKGKCFSEEFEKLKFVPAR